MLRIIIRPLAKVVSPLSRVNDERQRQLDDGFVHTKSSKQQLAFVGSTYEIQRFMHLIRQSSTLDVGPTLSHRIFLFL